MRPFGWRFNVFWQDGGDGSSGDGTGASATGAGAAADAAAAAAGYGGVGNAAGAPAGTSTTGTGSFGGGMGGEATAAPSATGTSVSFGGQAAPGGGVSSGVAGGVSTGVAGIGGSGSSAAGGFGGAATGGGGGTAAGGSGFGQTGTNPRSANLTGLASLLGIPPGVLTGVPTATTPVNVTALNSPSALFSNPNALNVISQALSSLNSPTLAQLAAQLMGNTLGGLAPGANSLSQTMGYPAQNPTIGIGGAPQGTPSPAQSVANDSLAQAVAPAIAALSLGPGGIGSDAVAAPPAAQQGSDTQTANQNTNAVQAIAEAMQSALSNPTALADLAQLNTNPFGYGFAPSLSNPDAQAQADAANLGVPSNLGGQITVNARSTAPTATATGGGGTIGGGGGQGGQVTVNKAGTPAPVAPPPIIEPTTVAPPPIEPAPTAPQTPPPPLIEPSTNTSGSQGQGYNQPTSGGSPATQTVTQAVTTQPPAQAAHTVAQVINAQPPDQGIDTATHAVTQAQQTMSPVGFQSFCHELIRHVAAVPQFGV